jgi:hypothetical protein
VALLGVREVPNPSGKKMAINLEKAPSWLLKLIAGTGVLLIAFVVAILVYALFVAKCPLNIFGLPLGGNDSCPGPQIRVFDSAGLKQEGGVGEIPLIAVNEGVCFFTYIQGPLEDSNDRLEILEKRGYWFLRIQSTSPPDSLGRTPSRPDLPEGGRNFPAAKVSCVTNRNN